MTRRSSALRSPDVERCSARGPVRGFGLCPGRILPVIAYALALVFAMMAAPAHAQSVPKADVQASEEDGFARLVLTFPERTLLPAYDARIASGVLRVTFPEPVDLQVPPSLAATLSSYVSVARVDPDGSGLRLALTADARINTMEAGEKLFIDLLPPDWRGMPPSLPEDVVRDLAQRAEEAMRKLRELEQAALENRKIPGVELRVGEHPTFTRLVFDWTVPFDSQFVREGDLVKVLFNHPVDLDISDLKVHLPAGVVDVTAFKAQEKLTFLLRVDPTVDIRAFREDNSYVVDVVRKTVGPLDPVNAKVAEALSDGTPPTATQKVTAAAESAPQTVDTGDGKPPQTPTSAEPVEAAAATGIGAGDAQQETEAPAGPPEKPRRAAAAAPDTEGTASEATRPASGSQTAQAEPAETRAPPVAEASTSGTAEAEKTAAAEAVTEKPVRRVGPPGPVAAAAETKADAPSSGENADDLSQLIAANTFQPQPGAASPARSLPDARPNPETVSEEQFSEIRNFVSVEARRIGDTVRIVFPFLDPVSSAVFRRGNTLWLVFDTDVPIDLGAARTALAGITRSIDSEEHGDWQAISMEMSERVLTTVGTDGSAWVMTIGEMILEPSRPLDVTRNLRGDGTGILRVNFSEPVARHTLQDAAVGDRIEVVTGFGPARGLIKPQSFVDLDTLSSSHGLAVVPRVDDLEVAFNGGGVVFQRAERGLSISRSNLQAGTSILGGESTPLGPPSYGDLVRLVAPNTTEYVRELQRREFELASLPAESRGPARLNLAQFQVANHFAAEALGLLALVAHDNPAIENDPVFNLTSGAANVLASRPKEALEHLDKTILKDSPDAAVWRMMADTALNKWTDARLAIPSAQTVIGNYPRSFQAEFNLHSARALVEVNDFGAATGFLAELDPTTLSRQQAARYDVLRGRVADAAGRSEEALRAFDIVAKSGDRPRAAEATYRALRIRYRDGGVDAEDAQKRLEGLTTVWRGDETELQALRFLAQLNAENGNYREAFESMRAAVAAESTSATTRLLQEEMNAVFSSLFLDGKADELTPIDALALYYDFRELTPIGPNGDEMVRRLADRLISVDLLEQAAELLQYQVDNRLKGVARAQIAADLALVYLLDRQPENALAVLNRTRQAQLPKTLDRQRRIVEARALAETGRSDLAMELVSNLRGPEVDRLRADTLWQAERWQDAGEQLERMHGVRWSDSIALEDQERQDILRSAIAYSFAQDQLGLDRLRSKYIAKMADSPSSAAFEVVTRPIDAKGVEFMAVARELAAIDTMESFLNEYRRHYLNSSHSASTPVGMADAESSPS